MLEGSAREAEWRRQADGMSRIAAVCRERRTGERLVRPGIRATTHAPRKGPVGRPMGGNGTMQGPREKDTSWQVVTGRDGSGQVGASRGRRYASNCVQCAARPSRVSSARRVVLGRQKSRGWSPRAWFRATGPPLRDRERATRDEDPQEQAVGTRTEENKKASGAGRRNVKLPNRRPWGISQLAWPAEPKPQARATRMLQPCLLACGGDGAVASWAGQAPPNCLGAEWQIRSAWRACAAAPVEVEDVALPPRLCMTATRFGP